MSKLLIPSRRQLLQGAAILAGSALLPGWGGRLLAQPRFSSQPFTLGVASGEPEPDGVVLWTRLAPAPFEEHGGMGEDAVPVSWEVAEDQGFTRVVQSDTVWAMPQAAHSVHVEVSGLRPDRQYFYRFHAGSETSPVGRSRTAPLPGDDVTSLRYAFTACQHYETGYYGAYRQMVADDPAVILFLGDYIYEKPGLPDRPRRHLDEPAADLASYRRRFSQYKGDANLQAAHATAPWMVMWDDHEVANNYNADVSQGGEDAASFLVRRAAAYQAYYEHMPLRRRSIPVGPDMQLYRSLAWGRLVQFQLLDGRQYRDDMPCREPGSREKAVPDCDARLDPARSLLGKEQERWLMRDLAASNARWNVVAQQFMMAEARRPDPATGEIGYALDGWDGYAAARDRLLAFVRDAKVANPIAIGGDSHAFIASHLAIGDGPTIMPAFVGGSLSSTSGPDFRKMVEASPQVRFGEEKLRGYSIVDVTSQETILTMRAAVDATDPSTEIATLRHFEMPAGQTGFT